VAKEQAQLGSAILAPCFYNFNRCDSEIGKTSGFQGKQDYHWMVAGIELEKYVTSLRMSKQQSEKQSSPDTADLDRLGYTSGANWLG